MRTIPNLRLEQHRLDGPPNSNCGAFRIGPLGVVVSDGWGWDHVSVSRPDRIPTWEEMDRIKRICFRDDEIVMQLHVNDSRKVGVCRFCLHLWRPQTEAEIVVIRQQWEVAGELWPYGDLLSPGPIPLPPREAV